MYAVDIGHDFILMDDNARLHRYQRVPAENGFKEMDWPESHQT
jgi:hypothetical protein